MPTNQDKHTDSEDPRRHGMGGDIGPASIRGSGVSRGGRRAGEAEPASGYSEPTGYMAGRDDDWATTAGSDEKAVGARTDQVAGDEDTFGPSPQPTPGLTGGDPETSHPGFRVRGPVDDAEHGVIDDEDPDPDDPEARSGVTAGLNEQHQHVTAGLDWSDGDEADPDSGSGRT